MHLVLARYIYPQLRTSSSGYRSNFRVENCSVREQTGNSFDVVIPLDTQSQYVHLVYGSLSINDSETFSDHAEITSTNDRAAEGHLGLTYEFASGASPIFIE